MRANVQERVSDDRCNVQDAIRCAAMARSTDPERSLHTDSLQSACGGSGELGVPMHPNRSFWVMASAFRVACACIYQRSPSTHTCNSGEQMMEVSLCCTCKDRAAEGRVSDRAIQSLVGKAIRRQACATGVRGPLGQACAREWREPFQPEFSARTGLLVNAIYPHAGERCFATATSCENRIRSSSS